MASRVERLQRLLSTAGLWRRDQKSEQERQRSFSCSALSGRLVELSGLGAAASLSGAVWLILEAQQKGDPVAWISLPGSLFFPPDVADCGVDLDSVALIEVPTALDAARAATKLLRCGAFGLVVLDLGSGAELPNSAQGRLVSLAQRYDSVVVCLTRKTEQKPSLGSMVSLRLEIQRPDHLEERVQCTVYVVKDKRAGPGWSETRVIEGPEGF